MRRLDLALAAVLVALSGCAPPMLAVTSDAPHATVLMDGETVTGTWPKRYPYYGTIGLDLVPAESPRGENVRDCTRELAELEPPAPEWLFPFDLAVESVHRLLHGAGDRTVHLVAPERPGTVVEVPGPRTLDLAARADQIRTAR